MMSGRLPVAVAGATGMVGQQFLKLLVPHPWFQPTELIGSDRTVGKRYCDVVEWIMDGEVPSSIADIIIRSGADDIDSRVVFSALPASAARTVEPDLSGRGHLVFTNASAFRMANEVPLLIPEVNAHALWGNGRSGLPADGGLIVANPNCVVAGLALVLAPLQIAFGLRAVTAVTLQALSGAGLAGVSSLAGLGNILPDISGEDDKIVHETRRILGIDIPISIATNRVPVATGHTASVFVRTARSASPDEAITVLRDFRATTTIPTLPSAPDRPLKVCTGSHRPQPARDIGLGQGMIVSVGGVREDPSYDLKFTFLVHNTIRGAAGASILNAELVLATDSFVRGAGTSRLPPSTPWCDREVASPETRRPGTGDASARQAYPPVAKQ